MNSSRIIAAAALSLLAAMGAQAETYEGVHSPVSAASRTEVNSEAVTAARSANPYAEGALAQTTPTLATPASRATLRAEAYAVAHAPNQNLDRKAFVNSVVPQQYGAPVQSTRQAVR